MARSRKDSVGGHGGHGGREYWSARPGKLPMAAWGDGYAKRLTRRAERRQGRAAAKATE
jgi:hypothetical protein